jgi:pyruvate decarboxylase
MDMNQYTIGGYLAARLEQAALNHYFAILRDYNLTLLDELLKNSNLHMINCCREE